MSLEALGFWPRSRCLKRAGGAESPAFGHRSGELTPLVGDSSNLNVELDEVGTNPNIELAAKWKKTSGTAIIMEETAYLFV